MFQQMQNQLGFTLGESGKLFLDWVVPYLSPENVIFRSVSRSNGCLSLGPISIGTETMRPLDETVIMHWRVWHLVQEEIDVSEPLKSMSGKLDKWDM